MSTPAGPAPGTPGPEARPTAPPARPRPSRQPGIAWYWLAAALLLAGAVWPLLGIRVTSRRIAALQRVPLPAGGRVTLRRAGTYVISYEARAHVPERLPLLRVTARPITPALRVWLLADTSGAVYAAGRDEGIAVLGLRVSRPGTVALGSPDPPAVRGASDLAVGPPLPGFMVTVMPGIGLMLLGITGIIAVATLRSRDTLMRVRYPSLAP